MSLRVYTACHPNDRGNSAGSDHLVTDEMIVRGRLRRSPGDALCRPKSKFWALVAEWSRKPTCQKCIEMAARLGLENPR